MFLAHKKQDYYHTTREKHQKERKTHSPLVLNPCALFSHLSLGRVASPPPPAGPPLSLPLASRVVGPVVEQGVHGVFFFFFFPILKGENSGVYGGFQRLGHT